MTTHGSTPEYAETDIHQHNATSERHILTLEFRLRALIYESGFPTHMWGQLVDTATWIYNRIAHSGIGYVTPYERYFSKPPKVSNMRIIGSRCYVLLPKVPKGKKVDPKSEIQYLVGYTSTGYTTYDPVSQKTTPQCVVRIDETILYKDDYPSSSSLSDFHFPRPHTASVQDNEWGSDTDIRNGGGNDVNIRNGGGNAPDARNIRKNLPVHTMGEKKNPTPNQPKQMTKRKINETIVTPIRTRIRTGKRPKLNYKNLIRVNKSTIDTGGDDLVYTQFGEYNKDLYTSKEVSLQYQHAIKDPEWQKPIQKEIDSWKRLNVFTLVPKTPNMKPVPVKWLFTIKNDNSKSCMWQLGFGKIF